MNDIFFPAEWIWTRDEHPNQYVALAAHTTLPAGLGDGGTDPIRIRITASSHYELFINGDFVGRGPVHGDPQWCLYDELAYTPRSGVSEFHIAIVAHRATGTRILSLRPARRGGVIASFAGANGLAFGTDASWKCLPLTMWRHDAPERGWALAYSEDYDATWEPDGWQDRTFRPEVTRGWENAVVVPDAEAVWGGYEPRPTAYLRHDFVAPLSVTAFRAEGGGAERM